MEQKNFPGQHDDEKILYVHRQHILGLVTRIMVVMAVAIGLISISIFAMTFSLLVSTALFLIAVTVFVIGAWYTLKIQENSIAYVTERRIVRLDTPTPFTVTSRSLSWDDTLKVKSYTPNIFWKLLNVGKLVIHAKSTMVGVSDAEKTLLTNDDIDLNYVYFYQDLGNYIDKILFLHKTKPSQIRSLNQFVAKPYGKRY